MDLKEALSSPLDLVEMQTKVPGQDTATYFKPMTCADHDKIARYREKEGGGDGMALVLTLIHKVVDDKGTPLFTMADKQLLYKRTPNAILVAMVNEIAAGPTIEEAEKN